MGRTWQPDPHADSYLDHSPYSWTGNNPVSNVDPDGRDWYRYVNEETGKEAVIWRKGDAASIDIDGATYSNVGTSYSFTYADGSVANYEQNNLTSFISGETTYGDQVSTAEGRQAIADFYKGSDVQVEFAPERTNRVINEEIKNFFLSWFRLSHQTTDLGEGTLAPPLIGPSIPSPPIPGVKQSKNLGIKKPTPDKNPTEFKKLPGTQGYVHTKTGEIYKKSHTSHGNPGNTGTQWKVWPKGTKDFGSNSKKSGTRTTIDGDGNVIGN